MSNIVGHQNGYLKEWSIPSQSDIRFIFPRLSVQDNENHKQYTGDVFNTLSLVESDIAYFDPPYGTNNKNLSVATRYSSFYHLWETIVLNRRPKVFGRASKPVETKGFTEPLETNKKNIVFPKIVKLIKEVKSKVVAFSYSNKGLLTAKDFEEAYRLAGCDMNSFRLYITPHQSNNQNKLALKNGQWIDRSNSSQELMEYLFISCKNASKTEIDLKTEEQNAWLNKEENLSYPDNTYLYTSYQKSFTKYTNSLYLGLPLLEHL